MAATDKETDDRWQLALDGIKEANESYRRLITTVQNGMGSLSTIVDGVRAEQRQIRDEIRQLHATEEDCKRQVAGLMVDVAAMKADGVARAVLMRWLLTFGMLNAIGAVVIAILLIYMVAKLFSLAG